MTVVEDETYPTVTRGWRDDALCRYVDMDLFFPSGDHDSGVRAEQTAVAKGVCAGCDVRAECLTDSLTPGRVPQYGVFGGVDEDERAVIVARRADPRDVGDDQDASDVRVNASQARELLAAAHAAGLSDQALSTLTGKNKTWINRVRNGRREAIRLDDHERVVAALDPQPQEEALSA